MREENLKILNITCSANLQAEWSRISLVSEQGMTKSSPRTPYRHQSFSEDCLSGLVPWRGPVSMDLHVLFRDYVSRLRVSRDSVYTVALCGHHYPLMSEGSVIIFSRGWEASGFPVADERTENRRHHPVSTVSKYVYIKGPARPILLLLFPTL